MAITEVTRRAITDELSLSEYGWSGRLDEPEFLDRLYDMDELPSDDNRFSTARQDVWQHRVRNSDWPDDWVFSDHRFGLRDGTDEVLLAFLAETVHPVVRPNPEAVKTLVEMYNRHLRADGFELHPVGEISGRPVFGARSVLHGIPAAALLRASGVIVDVEYISRQITRMESAVVNDPELAIGTAKELVETVCKTILDQRGVAYPAAEDLPQLVRRVAKELRLTPEALPASAKAADTVKRVLSNLASVAGGVNDLRNHYGTGHGKPATTAQGLQPRHARLATGAASTLALFLFETHEETRNG